MPNRLADAGEPDVEIFFTRSARAFAGEVAVVAEWEEPAIDPRRPVVAITIEGHCLSETSVSEQGVNGVTMVMPVGEVRSLLRALHAALGADGP